MKLSVMLNYAGDVKAMADELGELEKAGLDCVWVAEAYSFDAISMMGYLAARTERVEIGSAIVNVYSRTPTLLAMTFACRPDLWTTMRTDKAERSRTLLILIAGIVLVYWIPWGLRAGPLTLPWQWGVATWLAAFAACRLRGVHRRGTCGSGAKRHTGIARFARRWAFFEPALVKWHS